MKKKEKLDKNRTLPSAGPDQKAEKTSVAESDAKNGNDTKTAGKKGKGFFATLWSWTKRTFMGASKETADVFSVEAIESPAKQVLKNFFSHKIAVVSLVFLICMFMLVLIGPLFLPLDLNYTENSHKYIAPGYNMMAVPRKLKNNVKSISSASFFSVGVSNDNDLYVWGKTTVPNSPTKADLKKIPGELKDKKVAFAAAGRDHAIAITTDGQVIGWGEYDNGQYGNNGSMINSSYVLKMSDALPDGRVDAADVKQLVCGNRISAIVMNDGTVYCWGYKENAKGILQIRKAGKADLLSERVEKISFTSGYAAALLKNGDVLFKEDKFDKYTCKDENGKEIIRSLRKDVLSGNKIRDIATTDDSIALVTESGELVISNLELGRKSVKVPEFHDDEHVTQIGGGGKHYTVITDKGNVYSFGNNALKQCDVGKVRLSDGSRLLVGAFQNYIIDDNKVVEKWGCKGYLMGTDSFGRDIFSRIINGGKMTMTIGAVAVIISSIIGIVIGCLSGYFGGWVDMLLMRVTEVFAAIPFLPFAMILSTVLAGSNLTEDTRIFMIMVILGLLSWTGLARMIRGQVLAEREKEFVLAAKSMGIKEGRIAFKHILPNIISVVLVSMTLDFAGCMLTESSLSYLGFGVQLPRPTWGNMLNGANNEIIIKNFWWCWFFPSIFLLLTTISINIIGDTLRDVMDPKASTDR